MSYSSFFDKLSNIRFYALLQSIYYYFDSHLYSRGYAIYSFGILD